LTLYNLVHIYECGEEGNEENEIKELGIYSSIEKAQEAIKRYFKLPGFNNYPIDCFFINDCKVDKDYGWTEGFCSSIDLTQDFETLTLCFNKWLGIKKTIRESWDDENYYNALCEIHHKIYTAKSSDDLANHIEKVWSYRFANNTKNRTNYIELSENILELINSV